MSAKDHHGMLTESVIVDLAMGVAADFGDPTPTSIEYVYGTRNELNELAADATLDGAAGQAPSVLVQVTGAFTWFHSAPTNRNHISTGTAFALVIDEQTGTVTDRGLRDQPVDLTPHGPVFHPPVPQR